MNNINKLVVMQVLPSLRQGGVERGVLEIAQALHKAGIENYVVSSGGEMVSELEQLGGKHITLPVHTKNPFIMWLNAYRLGRIIKEKKVTVVHVRSRAPAWSVKWACRRLGVPFITTFHGIYGTRPEWIKKAYNKVMVQGRFVIAGSECVKQHLLREYKVPEQNIRLIYRGVDVTRFNPECVTKQQVTDFAHRNHISLEKPIITLIGRLSQIKGHGIFLDALKRMKHKKVTVLFAGGKAKPAYMEELKRQIDELPLETEVQVFSVPGNEIPVLLALSDIAVQPSIVPESFGRSMAEAQAMGKIVVASNHGGATELISNGRTGYLTPVGDPIVLANVLDGILDMSETERKKIGTNSIQSIQNHFSMQKMCDQTLVLYREFQK